MEAIQKVIITLRMAFFRYIEIKENFDSYYFYSSTPKSDKTTSNYSSEKSGRLETN
jgi:hypothetical protein